MCGIVGVVGLATSDGASRVRAMAQTIRHRGPDDDGFFDEKATHLGMRRLSIIDVAHGAQPIFNEDGNVVTVFNGEIYNYRELREMLISRGHRFTTAADTEVIVHLYEEFGPQLTDHLDGMFALAVWDRKTETLILARDRTGKKPLFYYEDGNTLWFGSELKTLLTQPEVPTEADPVAVDLYLTYQYVPHPWTILTGVKKLAPAHRLVWRRGHSRAERYWELHYAPEGEAYGVPEAELEEQLRGHILRATGVRMISERPLGAFLSGGLDSSAVVAAMAQQSTRSVKTFSIGFSLDKYNELPHARRVAELFGTEHHELVVEPDIEGILPLIARAFDEPFADSSAIPSYYVARMAAENVVVALNGDGGDESFGGYGRYMAFLASRSRYFGPFLAGLARRVATQMRQRSLGPRTARLAYAGLVLGDASEPRRYARQMSYFLPEERADIYQAEFKARLAGWDSYSLVEASWAAHSGTDPLNRLLGIDVDTYLPGDLLPKVDITTMAVSLEARSPFLDRELMEWAAGLPGSKKAAPGNTKLLLKSALSPWLPDDLIHRKKQGFGIPRDEWLGGPLQPMVKEILLSEGAWVHGFLRRDEILRLITRHQDSAKEGRLIWALLMLELWHLEVIRGSSG